MFKFLSSLFGRTEPLEAVPLVEQDDPSIPSRSHRVPGNPRPDISFEKMQLECGRGLHVGTVNLVAAAKARSMGDFVYAAQRNAFLDVLADPDTRKMMRQLGLGYVAQGDEGYIVGDA